MISETPDWQEVLEKLAQLERDQMELKLIVMGETLHKRTIKAEKLVIIDEKERPLAELGSGEIETRLAFFNSRGTECIVLGMEGDRPCVGLYDGQSKAGLTVSISEVGGLVLRGGGGESSVVLRVE